MGFIPVLYLVFTATASVTSYPFGRLADKTSRKLVIILGFVFFMFVCLGFIFLKNPWFLFVIYGLHKGALEPMQKAFVSELAPPFMKASMLGSFQMMLGMCALISSVFAGLLWDTFGMTAPFLFSSVTSACASGVMLAVRE